LTSIAGPDKIAALLGVSADSVTPTNAGLLYLSSDGSRIVFSVSSEKGKHILGINSDGTGLREYSFPKDYMWNVLDIGISGDGSKIFYIINPNPCCSTPQEVGVINFDGSDRAVLINGSGPTQDRGKLNHDGSLLLVGSGHGWLVDTKTDATLELTALGGWDSNITALVGDGMYLPSMDGSATKFLYLEKDNKDNWQLVIEEMSPSSLGEAPIITNPKIQPTFVLTKEKSASNVSASVAASNTIVAVGTDFLLNGLRDESGYGKVSLKSAGGGVFAGVIEGNIDIPIGQRIVRLKAEVKGSDGKRHATAVDLWPFVVAEGKDQATDIFNTQMPALLPAVKPPANTTPPIEEENINLTGVWSCNDGGVYYIRQIGDCIWWSGEELAANPRWANAAYGTISGRSLTIIFADVPAAPSTGYGTIVMDIVSNNELVAKDKPVSYAGSRWVRGERTTIDLTPPVTAINPWEDPAVCLLIDEWLRQDERCAREKYGPEISINEWDQPIGETTTAIIHPSAPPDHPLDWSSYHYLWFQNQCPYSDYQYRLREYVQLRQGGNSAEDLGGCYGRDPTCAYQEIELHSPIGN
jgi:hypothetical protein